jgi:hypothetical protein
MALSMRTGVQATIGPAGMAAGARGGTLASGSSVRPDWNDEPSESMWLENPEEISNLNLDEHCGEIMDPPRLPGPGGVHFYLSALGPIIS